KAKLCVILLSINAMLCIAPPSVFGFAKSSFPTIVGQHLLYQSLFERYKQLPQATLVAVPQAKLSHSAALNSHF
ncbi:MAG: hypothetical protein IKO19_00205, partial [Candidatus Riflebacteria bacterium]|nr:hypothetical protein [Candidatus Riflebacteria bacterium]